MYQNATIVFAFAIGPSKRYGMAEAKVGEKVPKCGGRKGLFRVYKNQRLIITAMYSTSSVSSENVLSGRLAILPFHLFSPLSSAAS